MSHELSPTMTIQVKPGYLAVVLTALMSILITAGASRQALSAHQRAVASARLEQVLRGELEATQAGIEKRALSPSPASLPSLQDRASTHLWAAHVKLIDQASGHPLSTPQDKAWFDAYWSTRSEWRSVDGARWAVSPHPLDLPWSARQLYRQPPLVPVSIPWQLLILSGLGSLTLALLSTRLFCGQRALGLLTPLSAAPFVLALSQLIATREQLSGVPLQGATLLPLCAVLPFLGLGISQLWTGGQRSAHRVAYTYMAPTLLSVSTLVFFPFMIGVALAFTRHQHGEFTWVGLSHFIDILSSKEYGLSHPLNFYFTLAVTLFWTATNVLLHTSIGLGLALLLNMKGLRLRGLYRALLIIPWAIPNYITALIWKGMFNQQYGLINQALSSIGLEPVAWMGSFWGAMAANIATNTWLGFPFMMVVTLGALQSVPSDLYEAAEIAGASKWVQLRDITLPLLKPALLPAVILGSVWTFNMFNIIYLVSGGQPGNSTDILITEAYRWAFEEDRYGYAAAYSLVIFFILLGYAGLTQKMSRSAEEVYR